MHSLLTTRLSKVTATALGYGPHPDCEVVLMRRTLIHLKKKKKSCSSFLWRACTQGRQQGALKQSCQNQSRGAHAGCTLHGAHALTADKLIVNCGLFMLRGGGHRGHLVGGAITWPLWHVHDVKEAFAIHFLDCGLFLAVAFISIVQVDSYQ